MDGFALVLVLWGTALLTVIAGSFAFSMRTETRLSGNFYARANAGVLAEAGINRAILALLTDEAEERWRTDGTVYNFGFADGSIQISITSESSKIDLNSAPEDLIRGLVRVAGGGEASSVADAILDWRDRDSRRQPSGAEDPDYAAAGLAAGAGDRPFTSIVELGQVLGVTPELQARLMSMATVHSRTRGIDPASASRDVLLAVPGLDAALVDEFVLAREDTESQGVLPPVSMLQGARAYLLPASLGRRSRGAFTLHARAEVAGGVRAGRRAVVNMRRSRKQPFVILAGSDEAFSPDAWTAPDVTSAPSSEDIEP